MGNVRTAGALHLLISVPGELIPQFTAALRLADNSEPRSTGASRVGGTRFCLEAGNAWEYLLPYPFDSGRTKFVHFWCLAHLRAGGKDASSALILLG